MNTGRIEDEKKVKDDNIRKKMRQQWILKSSTNASLSHEAHVTQELGDLSISTWSLIGIVGTKILNQTSYISSSQLEGNIHINIQDAKGSLSVWGKSRIYWARLGCKNLVEQGQDTLKHCVDIELWMNLSSTNVKLSGRQCLIEWVIVPRIYGDWKVKIC